MTDIGEIKGKKMQEYDELAEQQAETQLIIEELLADGSDPHAIYTIEHHLSCEHFSQLEKAAVEVFKLGYEVTDAEELEVEGGAFIFCCDVISKLALQADLINQQVEQLFALAQQYHVNYDGWGTYFEDLDSDPKEDDLVAKQSDQLH